MQQIVMLSANKQNYLYFTWDGRSFVNRKRKVGPKNNPYGGGGDNGIGLVVCQT